MKRIKGIKLYMSLLAAALLVSSCSDFLDVNEDPNRATDTNITPELLLTNAQTTIGTRQASRFVFLNNWMGYWARSGSFIVEQEETTYNIANTFTDNLWANGYDILFNLKLTKDKALVAKDSVLAGASMVLSSKLWQEQVDIFGAVPYSQAFNYQSNPRPAYDKANVIYADLLVQLNTAIKYLKTTPSTTFPSADYMICRNDASNMSAKIQLWIKFANTVKLRILLRQSEIPGFDPSTEIAKIVADGGVLGSGENISVNPGYSNALDKQSPFYASFGKTPAGSAASTNNKANNFFKTLLGVTDPRLSRFYISPVTGTDYGATNGNLADPTTQVVGSDIGPGLAGSATQDQWILPAYESMFLKAEAVARGWLAGDAKTEFEAAITESFVWLGVPSATTAAATYISSVTSAQWANAGTTTLDKAKFIAFQKYVALCGVDPLESWSDLRRLNMMPSGDKYLSNNPSRTATHLPYVLVYPQSETTTNAPNVPTRTNIFTEKLFWQTN
ncbi:MAG: SusD/RagB family nutrient-binding outer membrane lipoprotein [Bacteroidales bacterium]